MRVLLDENLPRRLLRRFGPGVVETVTVTGHGWSGLKNGTLLRTAEGEFDAFVTAERRTPHNRTSLA